MTGEAVRPAALVGGALVVDVEVAGRLLAVALRQARRAAARDGVLFDPALSEVLAVAEQAERLMAARGAATGTRSVPVLPVAGSGGSGWDQGGPHGSAEVARLAGVSERAVRKAASCGRLSGRQTAGRWVFTTAAARRWIEGRAGGAVEADQAGRAG